MVNDDVINSFTNSTHLWSAHVALGIVFHVQMFPFGTWPSCKFFAANIWLPYILLCFLGLFLGLLPSFGYPLVKPGKPPILQLWKIALVNNVCFAEILPHVLLSIISEWTSLVIFAIPRIRCPYILLLYHCCNSWMYLNLNLNSLFLPLELKVWFCRWLISFY